MKYIAFFFVLPFLSCNSQDRNKKDDLKIEITTTEINSRSNIDKYSAHNFIKFENFPYDSIPVNKINIRITNTGTKKYVFFIKKDLDAVERYTENIKFRISNDKEEIKPILMSWLPEYTINDINMRKITNEIETDSLIEEISNTYLKEKINKQKIIFQREMNYIVIHPGESKYFSYYKTLPVFMETISTYYMYFLNKNENYYLQLSLKNDANDLKKYITINQYNEIRENGYSIFNGEIQSNKVPVKFVKF